MTCYWFFCFCPNNFKKKIRDVRYHQRKQVNIYIKKKVETSVSDALFNGLNGTLFPWSASLWFLNNQFSVVAPGWNYQIKIEVNWLCYAPPTNRITTTCFTDAGEKIKAREKNDAEGNRARGWIHMNECRAEWKLRNSWETNCREEHEERGGVKTWSSNECFNAALPAATACTSDSVDGTAITFFTLNLGFFRSPLHHVFAAPSGQ